MKLPTQQATSFMLSLGLLRQQATQILERAQVSSNYSEELLSTLFPSNVLFPETPEYTTSLDINL
jgi:hypothetical protein